MRRSSLSLFFGLSLVLAGALYLLANFGLFQIGVEVFFGVLFAIGGGAFLTVFLGNREQWWSLIPGFSLLGVGGTIILSSLFDEQGGVWGGAFLMAMISLAFWVIYVMRREHWWALIPAGTLLSLAVMIALSETVLEDLMPGVFFLGLGATFGLVWLASKPGERQTWALIPGGILFGMGVIIMLAVAEVFSYIWPAALILVGIFLVYRTMFVRQR